MFQCPMCPRQLKSRSGLSGHLQFKHATKLQALETAPEQLEALLARALQVAPGAVPLEHIVDGLECTIFMLDNDVIQLSSAIDMQEIILWDIDTNVGIIQSEIKTQDGLHQKTIDRTIQGIAKLTADVELLARRMVELIEKFETFAANQHPPRFCQKRFCVADCYTQLKELSANTEKQIDHRFTQEKLKRLGLFS